MGASSVEDSASSSSSSSLHHRRSRSLSRPPRSLFSRDNGATPKGRFVNTVRGSDFPEISLDDLAIEFFESANRGRLDSRNSESEATPAGETALQRRGRSVSRRNSGVGDDRRSSIGGGSRPVSDANSRRRRSLSVVRYQISDSEVTINDPSFILINMFDFTLC